MLPAAFIHCPHCDRLITVDGLNPAARCTRECQAANDPDGVAQRAADAAIEEGETPSASTPRA